MRLVGRFVLLRWHCVAAIVASATPARQDLTTAQAARYAHHARHHHVKRHYANPSSSHMARASAGSAAWHKCKPAGFADTNASIATSTASGSMAASSGFGSSNVVAEARVTSAAIPRPRPPVVCEVHEHGFWSGPVSTATARPGASFASYGQRVSGPQIGAIAVIGSARRRTCRRGQRHDAGGNPIVCRATMATGSGKRQFRAGGFTPTSCRRTDGYYIARQWCRRRPLRIDAAFVVAQLSISAAEC